MDAWMAESALRLLTRWALRKARDGKEAGQGVSEML